MTQTNNTNLGAQARDVAQNLLKLKDHLAHLQDVCSALDLNQTSNGLETMICITQSSDLITKSASVMDSMANLLDPLVAFYAEIAEQAMAHAPNTPAWVTKAQEGMRESLGKTL